MRSFSFSISLVFYAILICGEAYSYHDSITEFPAFFAIEEHQNGEKIELKNDSLKYSCVYENGQSNCTKSSHYISDFLYGGVNTKLPEFVTDITRRHTSVVKVKIPKSHESKWFRKENRDHLLYKQNFSSTEQEKGLTYSYTENHKVYGDYSFLNGHISEPAEGDVILKYYKEERIKGTSYHYYPTGKSRVKHKFIIVKYSDTDIYSGSKEVTFNVDVNVTGEYVEWYASGKKKITVAYQMAVGRSVEPNKPEEIKMKTNTAHLVSYYPNGKKRMEGDMIDGVRVGVWKFYHPDGESILVESEYKEGKKDGKYELLNVTGDTIEKGEYELGKLVKIEVLKKEED